MKRLLTVTAFTAMLTLLRMAAGFAIAKIVAVYTGPTGMAMLGQVQSVVASLNGLVSSPAGSGIVRFTAEQHSQGFEACAPWWRASLQWVILLLAVTIPSACIFSQPLANWLFGNAELSWLIVVTAFVLPFGAVGTLINSVINGQQQYKRYVALGMVSVVISSCVMVGLIISANIKGALLAAVLQSGLIGFVMILGSLRQPWFKVKYWWGRTDRKQRKAIGGYIVMAVTSALTVPISLVLIRNILVDQIGWQQAGQWQAVWKISEAYLSIVTIALSTYYLPRLSTLKSLTDIKEEINKTAFVVMPMVILLAGTIYYLRDTVISVLFTNEFIEARRLFLFQLCGDVIKIFGWLYAYPMISKGATRWFVSSEVIFSCVFVLLAYFLISVHGYFGATIAYLINYALYLLFLMVSINKYAS